MTAAKKISVLICVLFLLSFLVCEHTGQPVDMLIKTNLDSSVFPVVQDFYVNNTWAGQPSQFSFNVTDVVAMDHAIFGCNITQTFTNDSSTPLSGTQSWVNYTHTLPNFNCIVSFQLWVWSSNSSTFATTGLRYIKVYTYNYGSGAWNTPYISLINAIQSIDSTNNWASVDVYTQTILAKKTTADLANMIENYASAGDWADVLKWSATCQKLNITRRTAIVNALGNFTMLGSLPLTDTGNGAFGVENRWGLYGYYYAAQFGVDLAKWNITAAYQQFNTSVFYCLKNSNALPLWVYGDGTSRTYSNRYYDEDASTVDCYVIFYSLLNVSDALNQALYCWNKLNMFHWNSAEQHYGYTGTTGYECEAPFFLKIISLLRYYSPNLSSWTNVLSDIETRFLSSEWNSPQWLSAPGTSAYVTVHMYPGNPQTRLENTFGAWQVLPGVYLQLNSSYESNMKDMLYGNNSTEPAWALLFRPETLLYSSSTNLFKESSTSSPSYQYTAYAETLLFMMGIVPSTTTIAFPLEELNYEYIQDIDYQILRLNLTARTITIPVNSSGSLALQYGVSPVMCSFSQPGVYQVTFSNSWNVITNVEYESALPDNLIYYGEVPLYNVTIIAHSTTEGADVNVGITMNGSPTGYTTPYAFTGLPGTHTFTVPDSDANGEPFEQWSTGSNSTTISVSSAGTYTAYYGTSTVHDVAITDTRLSKTVTGQGYSLYIAVTTANQGDFTETFSLAAYANATLAESQNVTLSIGNSITTILTLNTSTLAKGNYSISAYAKPVQGETDITDNNFTGGWIIVAMVGDLTGPNGWPDGKVDMRDIGYVARHYGAQPSSPRWDPNADINSDGKIDMKDISSVARHFGQRDP